ncbi:uncharacterized protein LOC134180170 [Corticium candelabrum]|uniref:uncharacterized protein LOC134180170 n=1 Tax=Corticium candelabrum TaxID=121492 RepID=UPI002E26C062|nr:uncharacterized protein LOC134180170 [Corticium candelabrum]
MVLARLFVPLLSFCVFDIGNSQLPSKRTYHPVSEDVPRVLCQTCQKGVRAAYKLVSSLRSSTSKKSTSEVRLGLLRNCLVWLDGEYYNSAGIQKADGTPVLEIVSIPFLIYDMNDSGSLAIRKRGLFFDCVNHLHKIISKQ